MELLKRVLKEEMAAVLASLKEDNYFPDTYQGPVTKDTDNTNRILYDYNKGALAATQLQNDIINLDKYDFVDYLPTSESSEKWNFIFHAASGMEIGVEIKKEAEVSSNYKNKDGSPVSEILWTMIFWRKYINEMEPQIEQELNNIKGYNKFVTSANMSLKDKIDPSKIR